MTVVIGPPSNFRVERADQGFGIGAEVIVDGFPDITEERLHVLLGRLDDEFAVVLSYVLTQKIKSFIYSHDTGLGLR